MSTSSWALGTCRRPELSGRPSTPKAHAPADAAGPTRAGRHTPDESGWLFDASRDYLTQLELLQSESLRALGETDHDARARARAELPTLERTVDELALRALTVDRQEAAARTELREAERSDLLPEKRRIVQAIARAFVEVRPLMDRLERLEDHEQTLGQFHADRLCWSSLTSGNANFEPLLTSWLARCREYGLLD